MGPLQEESVQALGMVQRQVESVLPDTSAIVAMGIMQDKVRVGGGGGGRGMHGGWPGPVCGSGMHTGLVVLGVWMEVACICRSVHVRLVSHPSVGYLVRVWRMSPGAPSFLDLGHDGGTLIPGHLGLTLAPCSTSWVLVLARVSWDLMGEM